MCINIQHHIQQKIILCKSIMPQFQNQCITATPKESRVIYIYIFSILNVLSQLKQESLVYLVKIWIDTKE